MPEVTASGAGVPVTLANEVGFYSKNGTNPIEPNLWFRGQTNGFEYQLTNANQANNATFGTFTNYPPGTVNQNGGWTFLPGGLILQYGTAITPSGVTTTTVVYFPIPFTTTNISITTSNTSTAGNATGITNKTLTTFTMNRGGTSTQTVNWMAIGL